MKKWIVGIFVTIIVAGLTFFHFQQSVARSYAFDQQDLELVQTHVEPKTTTQIDEVSLPQKSEEFETAAIATFLKSEVVKRTDFIEEVKRTNDLSRAIGGRVYIFEIRRLICSKELVKEVNPKFDQEAVAFFNKDGSGFYQHFQVGRDYLLFLSELPNQKKLKKEIELEENTIYFNPYPFDGKHRKRPRIREFSGELNESYLEHLKQDCREKNDGISSKIH